MLGSDHLTSRGGGGVWSGWNIFFTCFQRQNFFFSTIEGWNCFFLPCMMREVIFFIVPFVWIIICIKSVICSEKTTIHNQQIYNKEQFFPQFNFHLGYTHSSVLVLMALIVLKHLHQGCGTPEDHHTTYSQARTQHLARGGVRRGVRGSFCKIYMQDGGIWEPFQPYSDNGNCAHFLIFIFIRDHKCHCSQFRFIFLLSMKLFIRSIVIYLTWDLHIMYVSINSVYN